MKKLKITKIIVSSLVILSVLTLNIIGASAEWKQDSNGWWNIEGSSWSVGWRLIDGKWYYFNDNGYMKKGWLLDNEQWYFLDSNGVMQVGTIQVDGKTYYLGVSGEMQTGNVDINGETYSFATSGEATGNKIPQTTKAFLGQEIVTVPIISKDNGKTIKICLDGNPTTGYSWEYNIITDGIIKEDSSEYEQETTNQDINGAGGTYNWEFSGLKDGTTKIIFKYNRPWEKEVLKTKTYFCTVDKNLNITVKEI